MINNEEGDDDEGRWWRELMTREMMLMINNEQGNLDVGRRWKEMIIMINDEQNDDNNDDDFKVMRKAVMMMRNVMICTRVCVKYDEVMLIIQQTFSVSSCLFCSSTSSLCLFNLSSLSSCFLLSSSFFILS
mgnify:CR=1 FL=1